MTKKHEHAVGNMMTGALSSNQILSEASSKSSAGAVGSTWSATAKVGKKITFNLNNKWTLLVEVLQFSSMCVDDYLTSKGIRLSLVKFTSPWQLEEKAVDAGGCGWKFNWTWIHMENLLELKWEWSFIDTYCILSTAYQVHKNTEIKKNKVLHWCSITPLWDCHTHNGQFKKRIKISAA